MHRASLPADTKSLNVAENCALSRVTLVSTGLLGLPRTFEGLRCDKEGRIGADAVRLRRGLPGQDGWWQGDIVPQGLGPIIPATNRVCGSQNGGSGI